MSHIDPSATELPPTRPVDISAILSDPVLDGPRASDEPDAFNPGEVPS